MSPKPYPCMLCETLYAEMEEAEVCEQSHVTAEKRAADMLWSALRKGRPYTKQENK